MKCIKPFSPNGANEFGCGQCMPCRINRRRKWVGRLLLELVSAPCASFVTLTYADEHLMNGVVLDKRHLQNFLKMLRFTAGQRVIRYFACGEYGEESWRAHYHLILFGVHIVESALLERCWPWGMVHVGTVTPDSVEYVAGYVTKKMTSIKDRRLKGRPPEFAVMSRRPGIGKRAVEKFVSAIQSNQAAAVIQTDSLIPQTFKVGNRMYPMDRFTKGKLTLGLLLNPEILEKVKQSRMREQFELVVSLGSKEYTRRRRSQIAAEAGRLGAKPKRRYL